MAATTIRDRMARLGGPSLARRLAIVAAVVIVALGIFLVVDTGEEPGAEEADMSGTGAAESADSAVDGSGAEAEGIGGAANPGVFADAPTPLEDGSSPNATSATQGDEMLDLPPDPPGGGRVNPEETGVVAGERAEQDEVPEHVRESDVRTALPEGEQGDSAAQDGDAGPAGGDGVAHGDGSGQAATDGQTAGSESRTQGQ